MKLRKPSQSSKNNTAGDYVRKNKTNLNIFSIYLHIGKPFVPTSTTNNPMKYCLVLLSGFIYSFAFGQHPMGIKLYQNTDFFSSKCYFTQTGQTITTHHSNLTRFSAALNLTGKKFNQELEVFIPEIKKSSNKIQLPVDYTFDKNTRGKNYISTYSVRYEINRTLMNINKLLSFNLGLGFNPYFMRDVYLPLDNTTFNFYMNTYGISGSIIPRLSLKLSKQFAADINTPLNFYHWKKAHYHVDNPAIPIAYQSGTVTKGTYFPQVYSIRIGLTFFLN